jgi:mannose-6-phosphate isomerase-like protein (cupin superfamily)
MKSFDLASTFVVFDTQLRTTPAPVGPSLYENLDRDFNGFRGCVLVSEHAFESDWPTWERHPHGDELLYLAEGHAQLRILVNGEERIAELDRPGQVLLVPKGCWHTAHPLKPTRIVFITPGEGTENAVDPRASA